METIEAVYENGVLKPLKKINLREEERVLIRIERKKLYFSPIKLKKRFP